MSYKDENRLCLRSLKNGRWSSENNDYHECCMCMCSIIYHSLSWYVQVFGMKLTWFWNWKIMQSKDSLKYLHYFEYTLYSCYIMLARIVLRHTKTMQSSYNKELVEHQMDSRGQSPIVKSSHEKQASRKSLHKFKKRTDTVKSETNSTSNMQQSINRVKQSKNQIYKSTIW